MGQRKSTAIATRLSRAKQLSSRTFLPPINRYSSILAETASATLRPTLSGMRPTRRRRSTSPFPVHI